MSHTVARLVFPIKLHVYIIRANCYRSNLTVPMSSLWTQIERRDHPLLVLGLPSLSIYIYRSIYVYGTLTLSNLTIMQRHGVVSS